MDKNNTIITINRIFSDNLGDQLIGEVLKDELKKKNFLVIAKDLQRPEYNNPEMIKVNNMGKRNRNLFKKLFGKYLRKIVWKFKYKKMIKRILLSSKANYAIIGGGELLQDNEYFPVAISTWTSELRKLKIDYSFFGVGVKSGWGKNTKKLIKKSLDNAKKIIVRDEKSLDNLVDTFKMKRDEIVVGYDTVFLSYRKNSGSTVKDNAILGVTAYRRLLKHGNIMSKEEYYDQIIERSQCIKKKYLHCFITYTDSEDLATALEVIQYAQKKNVSMDFLEYKTLNEMKSLYQTVKFVESSRMHACILGILYYCNVSPVIISKKMESFKEMYLDAKLDFNQVKDEMNRLLNIVTGSIFDEA